MKFKKTFVGIFIAAFLIGYVLVLSTKKEAINLSELSDPTKVSETIPEKYPSPQIEKPTALETLEEINSGSDETYYPVGGNYPLKIKLLEVGEGYHGKEVEAKNGEVWLGLFKENDGYYFRPTKLKIRRVHDTYADDGNESKKTGKSVAVNGREQPVFLLKDAGTIRAGKITTLFQELSLKEVYSDEESDIMPEDRLTKLKKDFTRNFEFEGKHYELKVIEAQNKNAEKIWALTLESEGIRQVLHIIREDEENDLGYLFWVGDLDRDGKPDFYFDLFENYNAMNRVLFLSSQAEKGKLIKKVAYFWTIGC